MIRDMRTVCRDVLGNVFEKPGSVCLDRYGTINKSWNGKMARVKSRDV